MAAVNPRDVMSVPVTAALLLLGAGVAAQPALGSPTGELRCEPRWPQFCANVHVSCVGHTGVPARAFRLRIEGESARVSAEGDGADEVLALYAGARLERDAQSAELFLRPQGAQGYLQLGADGRYSLRHYLQHRGVMSIGQCRPLER